MKHTLLAFSYFFILTSATSQSPYWINAEIDAPLDELHDIIVTKDGGYIAVGGAATGGKEFSTIVKYNNLGVLEWETFLPFFGLDDESFYVNIALSIVETAEGYLISEFSNELGIGSRSSLTEIGLDGEYLDRNILDNYEINKLLTNKEGEVFAIVNEYLNSQSTTIIKYSNEIEEIWRTGLPLGRASSFDSHAYMDEEGIIQYWMYSNASPTEVIHYEVDNMGTITRQDSYPSMHTEDIVDGVLHGKLVNGNQVYVADGGDYNDGLFRELAVADVNTNEVINKVDISDSFFWITDLHTTESNIYVSGNLQSGDTVWTRFMVFDYELNVVNQFNLNELIKENAPEALGAVVYEFKIDKFDNILGAGTMYFSNGPGVGSFGYFSFYLNREGTMEVTSNSNELDAPIVHVFPNPSTEKITVDLEASSAEWTSLTIQSVTGATLKTIKEPKFPIEVEVRELIKGYYQLILNDETRQSVIPFIKE